MENETINQTIQTIANETAKAGFKLHNLMTGSGFEGGAYSSPWFMAWIGLFIIVVLIMLSKKWFEEEGIIGEYSFFGGFLGPVVYLIVVILTGSAKFSILAGLIGMFVGGKMGAKYQNG